MNVNLKLARAYVPFQIYNKRFSPMDGLKAGTIFPELYIPYVRKSFLGGDENGPATIKNA